MEVSLGRISSRKTVSKSIETYLGNISCSNVFKNLVKKKRLAICHCAWLRVGKTIFSESWWVQEVLPDGEEDNDDDVDENDGVDDDDG